MQGKQEYQNEKNPDGEITIFFKKKRKKSKLLPKKKRNSPTRILRRHTLSSNTSLRLKRRFGLLSFVMLFVALGFYKKSFEKRREEKGIKKSKRRGFIGICEGTENPI